MNKLFIILIPLCFLFFNVQNLYTITLSLSDYEIKEVGHKIWHNECGKSFTKLLWWHENEEFPSFGIGHFIWLSKKNTMQFSQTFPKLLVYLAEHDIVLPNWLSYNTLEIPCPWESRELFFKDIESPKMNELRAVLVNTIELQTQFIINQALQECNNIFKSLDERNLKHVQTQLNRLLVSPQGVFAVIDYINFKGSGLNNAEKYRNQGWGLLHILQSMKGHKKGYDAIQEFVGLAQAILLKRVKNAPKARNEMSFLIGWKNRVARYLEPL